jgi:hypothetical protein
MTTIFPGWRAVGRALMAARKRVGKDGFERTWDERGSEWLFTWSHENTLVTLSFKPGDDAYRLGGDGDGMWFTDGFFGGAVDTLRVLAALGLVDNDIAYAADERYGRCAVCGRLAQWVPPAGTFAERWCHLDPTRPYHKPEVADV